MTRTNPAAAAGTSTGAPARMPSPAVRLEYNSIDCTTALDVRVALIGALYSVGPDLRLDLKQVCFIDSTGLGMLVHVLKEARVLHGDLLLENVGPEVRRVLEMTGLGTMFSLDGPAVG